MKLESLFQYMDGYLGVADHPDHATALNGVQVGGPPEVSCVAAAVDASERTIEDAVDAGADLLVVHHGIFWDGLRPLTGRRLRKISKLVRAQTALYSVHLPLDAHAEVGNCALLTRALDIEPEGRFGRYDGAPIGWWGRLGASRDELKTRLEAVLDCPVRVVPGGPERIERVGVVTGGGASFIEEAARAGLDALVTGEGSHHAYVDAMELGVNVLYGGHYRTETFGVRALVEHVAERFDLRWTFIDNPTGF